MEPRIGELLAEGRRAEGIHQRIVVLAPHIPDQGIHGGEKIIRRGRDAHALQPVHIGRDAAGGVVGDKEVFAAPLPDGPQEIQRSIEEVIPQIDGAVHVQ